jgi:hypothetical protein
MMFRDPFFGFRFGSELTEVARSAIWPRHFDAPIIPPPWTAVNVTPPLMTAKFKRASAVLANLGSSRPPPFGEADLLVPAHESLHFLQGNGAIVVGIHCLEYALVRRLKLLQ